MPAFLLFFLMCCIPSLVTADDWRGLLGLLIVLFSLPVTAISMVVSLVLISKCKFRTSGFFSKYAASFIAVTAVLVMFSYMWNYKKSLLYPLQEESILLVIILLPGFIQYVRRHRHDQEIPQD
ncbi:hypothetical protein [Undibacterium pigrum]|uniref:hypothetical protein n=1 Tax=Undibacterium pigrum TaxID=401470 RepID=UPI000D76E3CC|nr:hypothetical protein [Undibacterium pigrum]